MVVAFSSRHCEEQSDEASQFRIATMDCFASLAMTFVAKLVPQRLVDQRLQRQLNPSALRRRLHHEDHEHIVLRIDKEEGAADAVPAIFAERPGCPGKGRRAHGKTETETGGSTRAIEISAGDLGLQTDMI